MPKLAAGESARVKILHVVPSMASSTGGLPVAVASLARGSAAMNDRVVIFTTDAATAPQARTRRAGATESDFPAIAQGLAIDVFPQSHPYRLAASRELGEALAARVAEFDLVHIHMLFLYPQFAAFRAANRAGVPYIVSTHGALDPALRRRGRFRKAIMDLTWQRRMINDAALLHLTTDDEQRLIRDLSFRAPQVVVPIGFDLSSFARGADRRDFRQRFGLRSDAPLILNHGRITAKKNLDLLVRAVAEARQQLPGLQLVLIGPDEQGLVPRLTDLAATLGLGEYFRVLPPMTSHELGEALAAADVWALPSATENFGLAVVEALAAGCPVITSPQVNIAPDAHLAHALVIAENESVQIATAIVDLIRSPQKRRELGANGRTFAARYDWQAVAPRVQEMYRSVLARHEERHGRR